MHPEKRFFPLEKGTQTDVAIRTNLLSDVYAVIGDPDGKGGYTLRLYYNPLVPWIWLGAAVMAFGGLVSLSDRRHRVGAPRAPARAAAAPADRRQAARIRAMRASGSSFCAGRGVCADGGGFFGRPSAATPIRRCCPRR